MTRVKICGIKTLDDARAAADAGADMIGLNFFKKSPRCIEQEAARALCTALRAEFGEKCPRLVGLFVNEIVSNISTAMDFVGLDFVQLSGDESVEMLKELRGTAFKAIRPRSQAEALDDVRYFASGIPSDETMPSLLLDAFSPALYGGTGEQAADGIGQAVRAETPRLMLAGGLTPDNVVGRIKAVQPWGVDVASGVEGDITGKKDHAKVRAFVAAAKGL